MQLFGELYGICDELLETLMETTIRDIISEKLARIIRKHSENENRNVERHAL
jgi:hypothetical protein